MESLWNNRVLQVVIVIGGLAVAIGYEFGVKPAHQKKQAYEGTITERYRKRDWLRGTRKYTRPEYHYYDYYWTVQCKDGKTRNVEVPHSQWDAGKVGLPVAKVVGQRWPYINTREAAQQREIKQQIFDSAVEGVKKVVTGSE